MNYRTESRIRRWIDVGMLALVVILLAMVPMMGGAMAEPVLDEAIGDASDVSWVVKYIDMVTLGVCLCVGLLIKHCTPVSNRYIPLIVAVVGLALSVWTHIETGVTPTVIFGGLISGIASTGFHQAFKQLFSDE